MTATVDTSVSPFLDARTSVAAAIESATGYECHASHTPGVATPCYVIEPDGWVVLTAASVVAYRLRVTALYGNQSGDLADGVEELARLAYNALATFGCRTVEVPAPGAVTIGNTEYAGVTIETTLLVTVGGI